MSTSESGHSKRRKEERVELYGDVVVQVAAAPTPDTAEGFQTS